MEKLYKIIEDWQKTGTARPMVGSVGGHIYGPTQNAVIIGATQYLKDFPYGGYMTTFGMPRQMDDKWCLRFFRSANCE